MNDMKQTKFKTFINYALAFFMAFFLFCAVSFALIGLTFSPEYAKLQIKSSNYIALSVEEIEDGLVNIAIPGGLPEDFFEYGITDKSFEDNIYKFIDSAYKNKPYTADDSAFRKEISEKIYQYAEKNMPGFSDEISEQLETLIDLCSERYMRYATPKALQYIGNYGGRLRLPSFTAALVALSLASVSFLFLNRANNSKRAIKIGFLGSGLLLLAMPLSLLLFAGIDKIGITSKPLYELITSSIRLPLIIMTIIALVIILAVIISIFKGKRKTVA